MKNCKWATFSAAHLRTSVRTMTVDRSKTLATTGKSDGEDRGRADHKTMPVDHETKKVGGDEPEWNGEQLRALELFDAGRNMFLTGAAGTGKSRLLNEMKRRCQVRKIAHAVTATTGIAAVQVGGTTINSWAGVGLGTDDLYRLVGRIRKFQKNARGTTTPYERWKTTQTLFIDETSMMPVPLFATLNQIGSTLRNNWSKPWGGIQIVAFGDFYQLPPVDKKDDRKQPPMTAQRQLELLCARNGGVLTEAELGQRYLFLSPAWQATIEAVVVLKTVYRQRDRAFVDLLMRARNAQLTDADCRLLRAKVHANPDTRPADKDGLVPPLLHAYRKAVDEENRRRLRKLPGQCWRLHRHIHYVQVREVAGARVAVEQDIRRADQSVQDIADKLPVVGQLPAALHIKVGAHVILLANLDVQAGLVNGLRGKIVQIGPNPPPTHANPRTATGPHTTTHAASRVPPSAVGGRSTATATLAADGAQTIDSRPDQVPATIAAPPTSAQPTPHAPAIADGDDEDEEQNTQVMPLDREVVTVQFEGRRAPLTLGRRVWKHCLNEGDSSKPEVDWSEFVSVSGLPLALASALTVHRSQGQTLTAAYLSLGSEIFQPGQAYVALSRLSSLDGLLLQRFSRSAFRTDPIVRDFYQLLEEAAVAAAAPPFVVDQSPIAV